MADTRSKSDAISRREFGTRLGAAAGLAARGQRLG
jgi:hypothetical protein